MVQDIWSFLQDTKVCWKHKFSKRRQTFQQKKVFWLIFSLIIEHEKRQETNYEGQKGNLTLFVEVIRSFLKDLRGWWKHNFCKKRQSFQWRKISGLSFSYNRLWHTWRDDLLGYTRLFDNYFGSYKIISFGHRLFITKNFEKKGNLSSEEKFLADFFSNNRVQQTPGDNL